MVLFVVQSLEARFETKGTFLELTKFLVTHSHVVEDLQGDVLITLTTAQVNHIKHSMSFLKQEKRIFKLFLLDVD